jgi:pyruvate carboxylase
MRNDQFRSGDYTTKFIEETPELFNIAPTLDITHHINQKRNISFHTTYTHFTKRAFHLFFSLFKCNRMCFRSGDYTTKFIEETPELFNIAPTLDRGTKTLEYIGNVTINGYSNVLVPRSRVGAILNNSGVSSINLVV